MDPRDINGKNYVQILKSYFRPGGEVGKENYIWDDALVVMALAACNESQSNEVKGALDHLKILQTAKGGWAWNGGANGEDPDTTSIILCAIISGGEERNSDAVKSGLQYLSSEQNADGGFSSLGSNAATDSWAILAIRAACQNPEEWKVGSEDPVRHLLSLQKEDGSIWWKSNSEGMSFEWTADMILALTGGRMPPVIYGQGG
jgi:squalene cyclase